jgi:hypothetical protein
MWHLLRDYQSAESDPRLSRSGRQYSITFDGRIPPSSAP